MDTLLKVLGGSLGAVVPVLFVLALRRGIQNAPFDSAQKSTYQRILIALIGLWTAAIWGASLAGFFSYHEGDSIPRFLIPLFLPVLIGVALLANRTVRTIVDHTPLSALVGTQAFRFAGSALFLVVYAGVLPKAFVSGGFGDVATGALAIFAALKFAKAAPGAKWAFWSFTLVGLGDLVNVLFLLLAYYPIWNSAALTSAPAGDFALVMLPAIAAPVALLLHAYAVRGFCIRK